MQPAPAPAPGDEELLQHEEDPHLVSSMKQISLDRQTPVKRTLVIKKPPLRPTTGHKNVTITRNQSWR